MVKIGEMYRNKKTSDEVIAVKKRQYETKNEAQLLFQIKQVVPLNIRDKKKMHPGGSIIWRTEINSIHALYSAPRTNSQLILLLLLYQCDVLWDLCHQHNILWFYHSEKTLNKKLLTLFNLPHLLFTPSRQSMGFPLQ